MTAYYNRPDDDADTEASFHSLAEATAYTEAYGGDVEARGVVFVVGKGSDHARAKRDARADAEGKPRESVVSNETPASGEYRPQGWQ